MKRLSIGVAAVLLVCASPNLGCLTDASSPSSGYVFLEVESDGPWEFGAGWKPSRLYGLILRMIPESGNQIMIIGRARAERGLFCALIIPQEGTRYVRARILIPFNPEGMRKSPWEELAASETRLDLCYFGYEAGYESVK